MNPESVGEQSSKLARRKLTTIINRVKMDREVENLKDRNNNQALVDVANSNHTSQAAHAHQNGVGETGIRSKLNIANVRSAGKTLHLPTSKNSAMVSSDDISGNVQLNDSIETNSTKNGKPNGHVRFNEESLNSKNTNKNTSRVGKRPAHHIEHPLPYANLNSVDLTCVQMGRRRVYRFVMSPWFEISVTIFIVLNTICLALEYHGMNSTFRTALNIANHVSMRAIYKGLLILVFYVPQCGDVLENPWS